LVFIAMSQFSTNKNTNKHLDWPILRTKNANFLSRFASKLG
jgi:hypothetical protein